MTREQMIRELIYHDIYGNRDEFLKEVVKGIVTGKQIGRAHV